MKDNKLIKSGVSGVVDGENQTVGDDELELINRFTRRNLAKNEVYAFSVVLCDNDVDRDGERFTTDSLYELEKLFVGKTGKNIFKILFFINRQHSLFIHRESENGFG